MHFLSDKSIWAFRIIWTIIALGVVIALGRALPLGAATLEPIPTVSSVSTGVQQTEADIAPILILSQAGR